MTILIIQVRLLTKTLNPPISTGHTLWLSIQQFMTSSLIVIMVDLVNRKFDERMDNSDIQHLTTVVNWIFADTIGSLVTDVRIKWVYPCPCNLPSRPRSFNGYITLTDDFHSQIIVVVGCLIFPSILGQSESQQSTPLRVWLHGVSMAWVNILVGLLVQDTAPILGTCVNLVAALGLACCIDVFGRTVLPSISPLSGYMVCCPLSLVRIHGMLPSLPCPSIHR